MASEIENVDSSDEPNQRALLVFWMLQAGSVIYLVTCGLFALRLNEDIFGIIAFSCMILLASFMGAFAGLGNRRYRTLLVALLTPVLGLLAAWSLSPGLDELFAFELFIGSVVVIVGITTCVLRVFKGRIQHVGAGQDYVDGLRFGIRDVMIWTTVVAILIPVVKLLVQVSPLFNMFDVVQTIGVLAACVLAGTVVCIWSVFGRRLSLARMLVSASTLIGSSICASLFAQELFFGTAVFGGQLLSIIAMASLRAYGYRFVKS